jgi:hypothetical protein
LKFVSKLWRRKSIKVVSDILPHSKIHLPLFRSLLYKLYTDNHAELIKWIHSIQDVKHQYFYEREQFFYMAASNGNVELLHFLKTMLHSDSIIQTILGAVTNNHFHVIEWLIHSKVPDDVWSRFNQYDFDQIFKPLFISCFKTERTDILEVLIQNVILIEHFGVFEYGFDFCVTKHVRYKMDIVLVWSLAILSARDDKIFNWLKNKGYKLPNHNNIIYYIKIYIDNEHVTNKELKRQWFINEGFVF